MYGNLFPPLNKNKKGNVTFYHNSDLFSSRLQVYIS